MSFTDALNELKTTKEATCSVARMLAVHEDANAVEAALADWMVFGTTIAAALEKTGHKVPAQAIQMHRRGVCSCRRP